MSRQSLNERWTRAIVLRNNFIERRNRVGFCYDVLQITNDLTNLAFKKKS